MKDFAEYKFFDDVYARENELYDDIKDMWTRNDVIISDMDERAKQILVGVLYREQVVGVVTRVVINRGDNHTEIKDKNLAYVRDFIDPNHRSFKLLTQLFGMGLELMKSRGIIDGVIFNSENKKFDKPGYRKRLIRKGFIELPTSLDTTYWYMLF